MYHGAWKALRSEATVTGYGVPGGALRGRCAWNVRASERNQVYLNCRAQPKISKKWHYAKGPHPYFNQPTSIFLINSYAMTEDKNKEQELKENVQEQTPETNIVI